MDNKWWYMDDLLNILSMLRTWLLANENPSKKLGTEKVFICKIDEDNFVVQLLKADQIMKNWLRRMLALEMSCWCGSIRYPAENEHILRKMMVGRCNSLFKLFLFMGHVSFSGIR